MVKLVIIIGAISDVSDKGNARKVGKIGKVSNIILAWGGVADNEAITLLYNSPVRNVHGKSKHSISIGTRVSKEHSMPLWIRGGGDDTSNL